MVKLTGRTPKWLELKKANRGRPITPNDLLREFGIIGPPIDIEEIISLLEVDLVRVHAPGWYGAVAADESTGQATIWVKAGDAPVRQRFTMAHEVGHLLLHPSGVAYRDNSFRGGWKEREANQFAADLLMPPWMLGPLTLHYGGDESALAGIFDVSQEAMGYQVQKVLG